MAACAKCLDPTEVRGLRWYHSTGLASETDLFDPVFQRLTGTRVDPHVVEPTSDDVAHPVDVARCLASYRRNEGGGYLGPLPVPDTVVSRLFYTRRNLERLRVDVRRRVKRVVHLDVVADIDRDADLLYVMSRGVAEAAQLPQCADTLPYVNNAIAEDMTRRIVLAVHRWQRWNRNMTKPPWRFVKARPHSRLLRNDELRDYDEGELARYNMSDPNGRRYTDYMLRRYREMRARPGIAKLRVDNLGVAWER